MTKSLSRLIGGIVSLVTLDELSGAYANQETWALNMTKASVSQLGAGLGAVAPAVGKALSTIGILVVKVVIVAVAVYVAYRALKLMWKLAVWVAYKIRDYFTKEKPDEEESKECEDWNASNAMIVYDILEKAIQYFFEDKDKGKPWQYAIKTIRRRHGAKVLLENKSNPTVKAFLTVACCALQNQSNVTEQCALDILKTYLDNRIFNLDIQNKKAEAYATLQDYYKRHELFFLWQIDRILIGNLEAVDHTRYFLPEEELPLAHEATDKQVLKKFGVSIDKINQLIQFQKYIVNANAEHRNKYRNNPYHEALDNCTYCVMSLDNYLKGYQTYPLNLKWPLSHIRFLDFYGIDYDHNQKFEDARSPKSGKGWLRNTKSNVGGLSLNDLKKKIGKNSSGIIRIVRKGNNGSHVYNMYSTKDAIVFVDLQAGQILSPNIDHIEFFGNKYSDTPFELLRLKGLKPIHYPSQPILIDQKAIKFLIKNVQNKSVKYIVKLIPKMYRLNETLYDEGDIESSAHPIIYKFVITSLKDERKLRKKRKTVHLWLIGKSNKQNALDNIKLGKTLRIQIFTQGQTYFFDRYGNLHHVNKLENNPKLANDTFIPIDGNPGKK